MIDMPLISKTMGWGIYDKNSKRVLFMGGYGYNCVNENKINKFLHICTENLTSVTTAGKTSKDVFLNVKNYQLKVHLYPFIYGLSFIFNGNECFFLNTNGTM
jgi:hypothetical protein